MFILKWLVVMALSLTGVLALLRGSGTPMPFLEYKALELFGVSGGMLVLVVALVVAYYWETSNSEETGNTAN